MCLSISQLDSTSSASKLTDHQLHFVLFFSFWCFIDTFLWHKNKIAHHSSPCSGINSSTTEEARHLISSDQEEEQEGVRMPGRCRDGGCWMKICLHYESLLRCPCRRLNFETNGQSGRWSCSLFLQKKKLQQLTWNGIIPLLASQHLQSLRATFGPVVVTAFIL